MSTVRYIDFDVKIERADSTYRATVLHSPAGEATLVFAMPFSEEKLENLLLKIGQRTRGTRQLSSPEVAAETELGEKLYGALFNSEILACLRSTQRAAEAQENTGVRIKLRLQDVPELMDVPWEFLLDPSLRRFFAQSNQTPVVRYVEPPELIRPRQLALPLRLLVMASSPSDLGPLDVNRKKAALDKALAPLVSSGAVEVDWMEEATLSMLQRRLRTGRYHAFHYIGHGGFDTARAEGLLALTDASGRSCPVDAHLLGTLLRDHRSLRLVFLNSCEGARTSRTGPFPGVATTLVQSGVPAVVEMQFEITDEAVMAFAGELYTSLTDGLPVDAAVAEGRKAVLALPRDVEWGTPTLYMSSPDGVLFEVAPRASVPLANAPAPSPIRPPSRTQSAAGRWRWILGAAMAGVLILSGVALVVTRRPEDTPQAYREACDSGEANVCTRLGLLYENGSGVPKNRAKAAELFRRACDGGDAWGCVSLGESYGDGSGVPKDPAKAAELYRKACDDDSMLGCNNLGAEYAKGHGVPKDPAKATELFRRACDGGDARGCFSLGWSYGNESGAPKDLTKAAELYLKACDGGEVRGCVGLGVAHESGRGVPKDLARAAELYRKACDGGAPGCTYLGVAYENGSGVPKDLMKAAGLYLKACEGGDARGCFSLGGSYNDGNGVPRDPAKSAELYRKACDGDYALGCSRLGSDYESGVGVPKDLVKAVELYRKACDGGEPGGCNRLGWFHDRGSGVPKDLAQAAEWYRRACEGGDMSGCANLGRCYENGAGVPKDLARAIELYGKACEGGDMSGCNNLGWDNETGAGLPKDLARAAELYRKACDGGDMNGCNNLGVSYRNGHGVPKDLAKAAELYQRACAGGHEVACDNMLMVE